MGNRLYDVFILLLVFAAAYLFYAIWHIEEPDKKPQESIQSIKVNENLADKKITPKRDLKTTPKQPSTTEDKNSKQFTETKKQKTQVTTFKQMKEKTQDTYDELVSSPYEEIKENADIGFKNLDLQAIQIEKQIAKEETHR